MTLAEAARIIECEVGRITALADSIEVAMWPVGLISGREAAALRRFGNDDHLVVARRLGIPQPVTAVERARMMVQGRLVPLEDSKYWKVRNLEYSQPLVTPEVISLLTEVGKRFQDRLAERNVPPLRLDITSVLRSEEDQRMLRRRNANATRDMSTHQFGTTVDVAYHSYGAPLDPVLELDLAGAPWLEPALRRLERFVIETGAQRVGRELQNELGSVLRELQDEGVVLVTMERRQPVFHMTVAETPASSGSGNVVAQEFAGDPGCARLRVRPARFWQGNG